MYPQVMRLNLPTYVIGPALGKGSLFERPADILKIWPDQEPVRGSVQRNLTRSSRNWPKRIVADFLLPGMASGAAGRTLWPWLMVYANWYGLTEPGIAEGFFRKFEEIWEASKEG